MYSKNIEKSMQKNAIEIVKFKNFKDGGGFVNQRAWKSETNLNREKSNSDWYISLNDLNEGDEDDADDDDDDDDKDSTDENVSYTFLIGY